MNQDLSVCKCRCSQSVSQLCFKMSIILCEYLVCIMFVYLIAELHLIARECNMLKYNCLTSWCAVANVCNVFLAVACYLFVHVIVLVFCSVRIILNKTACKSEISLQLLVLLVKVTVHVFKRYVANVW